MIPKTPDTKWKPTATAGIVIKGALIGIANIIPGVSGGTFALILGIYERLLASLRSFNYTNLKTFATCLLTSRKPSSRRLLRNLLQQMDIGFLVCLAIGGGFTILGLSFVLDYLLTVFPGYTLSFFLGLLIPSIAVPWKMMSREKSPGQLFLLVPGVALTIGVSLAFGKITAFGDNLFWSFITGAIAISAMILPGISGSYVLLVMGQYQNILRKLQALQTSLDIRAITWLAVFSLGCIIGLLLFSKLLGLLLKHYRNATLAFLIGLIIGSFWILWPFKDYQHEPDVSHIEFEFRERVSEKQDIRIATARNRLPETTGLFMWNAMYFVAGLAGAFGLNRFNARNTSVSNRNNL